MGISGSSARIDATRAAVLERAHKQVSDAVAYGLLVYTALQIFMTMHALAASDNTLLPVLALVVLVGAIIPLYRHFERRWDVEAETLADDDRALHAALTRTRLAIWAISIGLPLAVTALIKAVAAAF